MSAALAELVAASRAFMDTTSQDGAEACLDVDRKLQDALVAAEAELGQHLTGSALSSLFDDVGNQIGGFIARVFYKAAPPTETELRELLGKVAIIRRQVLGIVEP
jgi:acyl-CoA reductase-like NAD-dependent aldehyde dehydrogenase